MFTKLHCILVDIPEHFESKEHLIEMCRKEALGATDAFSGDVYHGRAEDAGSCARHYPNRGVVLGYADPDMFKKLLEEWKDKPLFAAGEFLEYAKHCVHRYRTPKELAADGAVCMDEPLEDGRCWSGVPVQIPQLGPELLKTLWESDKPWRAWLSKAIRLAAGEYHHESCFFSVPDLSVKISSETLRKALETPKWYALVFLEYWL